MSRTNIIGRPATSSGSANGPAGLGAAKVPSASHRSCQRDSISAASPAVYWYIPANSAVPVSAQQGRRGIERTRRRTARPVTMDGVDEPIRFDTKIAVLLRDDLAVWQRLNV